MFFLLLNIRHEKVMSLHLVSCDPIELKAARPGDISIESASGELWPNRVVPRSGCLQVPVIGHTSLKTRKFSALWLSSPPVFRHGFGNSRELYPVGVWIPAGLRFPNLLPHKEVNRRFWLSLRPIKGAEDGVNFQSSLNSQTGLALTLALTMGIGTM